MKKDEDMVFVPWTKGSCFNTAVESRKTHVINEVSKDRDTISEIRTSLGLSTMKINNLILVPVGDNQGKKGGAMVIVLINKFFMGDEDKPTYENFTPSTTSACNKVFQKTLVHILDYNALNKRVHDEIIDENVLFSTINKIMQ